MKPPMTITDVRVFGPTAGALGPPAIVYLFWPRHLCLARRRRRPGRCGGGGRRGDGPPILIDMHGHEPPWNVARRSLAA